nr:ATP-binding protein [Deinococcus budaensis]
MGERLQAVTEALAAARTQQDVFRVVLTPARQALNAVAGAVLLTDEAGERLNLAAVEGHAEGVLTLWQAGPLAQNAPAADALGRREALLFEHQEDLVRAYPQLAARSGSVAVVATAVLPMFLDDRPLGVLVLDFREPHHFTPEEVRFLRTLAAQCAVAVGRSQLLENLQRQVEERTRGALTDARAQEAFVAFTEAVGTTTDVLDLTRQAIAALHTRFGGASVGYYTREGALWKAQAWSEDMGEALLERLRAGLPDSTPFLRGALETGTAVFTDSWDPGREGIEHSEAYGKAAAYPLVVGGEVRHLLLIGLKDTRRWSGRDRALVRAVGRGLTLALERAEQAAQQARQTAELDARNRALESFADLTRDLSVEVDPYVLVRRAQAVALSLLPEGYALYFEPQGERWVLRGQTGELRNAALQAAADAGLPYHEANNLLIPYRSRAPYYQDQYARDTDNLGGMVSHLGASATLPVLVDGQPRGVFAVVLFGGVRHWTRPDQAALESVVRSLGLALERAGGVAELEARTREVAEWRERYEVAVRGSGALLYDWDPATDAILYGGAVEQITGYAPQELGGTLADWTELLIHPDDRGGFQREIARVIQWSDTFRLPFRVVRRDGSVREVEDEGYFRRDAAGQVTHMVGFVKDVTERKRAEQALLHANEELRRSNAELEQFAYVASHDLQAPIRAVTSFAGILLRKYGDVLDERGQLYLRQVVDSGEHMKQLVDDLLAFSRVHTQRGELRPVDSAAVFDTVASRLGLSAPPGADLSRGELPMVLADAPQLDQLLQNLIANGLKYHREGVRPQVRVTAERDGDGLWRFQVTDNGIGIEPQYFERIFVIFQRLHGREAFEGTGIGLAVCKKIVERHGGRLWLESTPGQGSSFFFTLPGA